jgi:hypothetical protein
MKRVKAEKNKMQPVECKFQRARVLRWPRAQTCEALARMRVLRVEQRAAGIIDLRAELMGEGSDYSA